MVRIGACPSSRPLVFPHSSSGRFSVMPSSTPYSASFSGCLIVAFELRLKNISVTHMIGALLGGAVGLLAAKTIGAALYWANLSDGRVVFLHSVILLALPYLGLVIGGRKGVARAGEPREPVPVGRAAQALQGSRYERDHRRPHRRYL